MPLLTEGAGQGWLQDREGGGSRWRDPPPPFANTQPGVWGRAQSVLDGPRGCPRAEVAMEVEDRQVWLDMGRPHHGRPASSRRKWKVPRGHWRKIWTGTQGWGASEGLPGEGKRQPDTLANAWLGQSGGTFLISFLPDELGS